MTGTLSGYLIYRLQDKIKAQTNIDLSYNDIINPLTESLLELTNDMNNGEFIELPNGSILTITKI